MIFMFSNLINVCTGKYRCTVRSIVTGSKVGIYVDTGKGTLAFFHDGEQISNTFHDPRLTGALGWFPFYPTVSLGGDAYTVTIRKRDTFEIPTPRAEVVEIPDKDDSCVGF